MTGVSDKIKKVIVDLFTQPFKEDDLFEEMTEDFGGEYPTEGSHALEPAIKPSRQDRLKVVPMTNKNYEVVVFEPRAYNEAVTIIDALKERKTVILNLQLLDKEQSQRIVDFLCGCTQALEGNQRKIGEFVFIFTPSNINLTQELVNSKLSIDARWNQAQTL